MSSVFDIMSKNFFRLRESDSVSEAISLLKKTGIIGGLILGGDGKYRGVVHVRDLIRLRSNPKKTKIKSISKKAPILSSRDNLEKVARLMLESDVRVLPVIEKERILGVIYDFDLIRALSKTRGGEEKVEEVMVKDVVSLDAGESIARAIHVLVNEKISHLPILKKGRLAGLVSTHDVAKKMFFPRVKSTSGELSGERIQSFSIPAEGLMSSPVVTVDRGTSIRKCIELMVDRGIGSLVVVDHHLKIRGIVTRKDILEFFVSLEEEEEKKTSYFLLGDISFIGEFERSLAVKLIEGLMTRAEQLYGKGYLFIHVKRLRGVRKSLIDLRTRLHTPKGTYYAGYQGFNFVNCLRMVIKMLERYLITEKEILRRRTELGKEIFKAFPELFQ